MLVSVKRDGLETTAGSAFVMLLWIVTVTAHATHPKLHPTAFVSVKSLGEARIVQIRTLARVRRTALAMELLTA